MWIERWQQLAKNLKRQGAFVQPSDIQPVATEQELQQVEAQLGIQIPSEFRQVLQKCSQQVDVYWTLPDEVIIPSELTDIPSGDFGWSLANLYVPGEQLYLQFHSARNGDAVLIKLEDATIAVKAEKWRPLLAFWEEHEVLRKNKQLFRQALNGLDNWLLKQQREN